MRALLLAALVAAQEVYRFDFSLDDQPSVSYTHLTLPTNREV